MSTIENYSSRKTRQVQKGTIENPYTEEEYEAMLDAGTWTGGYVEGLGYCGTNVIIDYDSSSFSSSFSNSSDPEGSEDEPSDGSPLIDPNDHSGSTENDEGAGGNGNTGGNTNSGSSSSGHGPCCGDTYYSGSETVSTSQLLEDVVNELPQKIKEFYDELKAKNLLFVEFIESGTDFAKSMNASAWIEIRTTNGKNFYYVYITYEEDNILSPDNYVGLFRQELFHAFQRYRGIYDMVNGNKSLLEYQENMLKWLSNSTQGCGMELDDNKTGYKYYEQFRKFMDNVCTYTNGVLSSIRYKSFLEEVSSWYNVFISRYTGTSYAKDATRPSNNILENMGWEMAFDFYGVNVDKQK